MFDLCVKETLQLMQHYRLIVSIAFINLVVVFQEAGCFGCPTNRNNSFGELSWCYQNMGLVTGTTNIFLSFMMKVCAS